MASDYDSTFFFYPSGGFVSHPTSPVIGATSDKKVTDPTLVYNPAPIPNDDVFTFASVPPDAIIPVIKQVLGTVPGTKDIKTFTIDAFNAYTDRLVELSRDLRTLNPNCVLFPLRGGKKPRQILDALLDHALVFEEFAFTRNSDPNLYEQYYTELAGIVTKYADQSRDLTFAVVDAGIGGNGGNRLAKLLRRIHSKLGGKWKVVFHILFVPRPEGAGFAAVQDKSNHGFKVLFKGYPVHDLLVEDWTAGIGLRTQVDGKSLYIKPSVSPGAIFVQSADGHGRLAVGDDARRVVNRLISDYATRRLHQTHQHRPELDIYRRALKNLPTRPVPIWRTRPR